MSQHDYVLADAAAAALRADLNNALAAILSQNSGATAPTTTCPYMVWVDTGTSPARLKIRNAGDTDWVTLAFRIDTETLAADAIQESTAGAGITIDGLTVKDSGFALGSDADGDLYYRAGGVLARLAVGTAGEILTMNSGATAPEWTTPTEALFNAVVKISHRVAQGTSVAATAGWNVRPITDLDYDPYSIASIASNRITLPAGTYYCDVSAMSVGSGGTVLSLYNYTTSAFVQEDTSAGVLVGLSSGSSNSAIAHINGVFTLAASSQVEIRQYNAAADSFGLGEAANITGYEEVYMTGVFKRFV